MFYKESIKISKSCVGVCVCITNNGKNGAGVSYDVETFNIHMYGRVYYTVQGRLQWLVIHAICVILQYFLSKE